MKRLRDGRYDDVSVQAAADLTGMGAGFIRNAIEQGTVKYGCMSVSKGRRRNSKGRRVYHIMLDKFMAATGRTVEEVMRAEHAVLLRKRDSWGNRGRRDKLPPSLAALPDDWREWVRSL